MDPDAEDRLLSRLVTADDLRELPEDEAAWVELVRGRVVRVTPPSAEHGICGMRLAFPALRWGLGSLCRT